MHMHTLTHTHTHTHTYIGTQTHSSQHWLVHCCVVVTMCSSINCVVDGWTWAWLRSWALWIRFSCKRLINGLLRPLFGWSGVLGLVLHVPGPVHKDGGTLLSSRDVFGAFSRSVPGHKPASAVCVLMFGLTCYAVVVVVLCYCSFQHTGASGRELYWWG